MTLPITTATARELARLRARHPDVDLVVIGAAALAHHVPLSRTTADVDLAFVVTPADLVTLLEGMGWQRDPRLEHRWSGPDAFVADALPATPELVAAGGIAFEDGGRVMSLVGYDLVFEHAAAVELPGTDQSIRVASFPTLVILKMAAWLDRPAERRRDLGDLVRSFRERLAVDDERRWGDEHAVGASGLDFDAQSPFFVGLEVAEIALERHRALVDRFVERFLADTTAAAVAAREADLRGEDVEELVLSDLRSFDLGFRGERRGS